MLLACSSLPPVQWMPLPALVLPGWREEIAVYRVPIVENQPHAPRLYALLPEAEQQRARRYHVEADYYRFVVGRAALRLLIGYCLGQPPTSLRFEPGPNRKPVLATSPQLHYNVSHAGNWVVIAIAPVEIGIDMEKLDLSFPFQELLPHSFSPVEQAFIRQQRVPAAAFFQLWTRKEALVKATAQGIDEDFGQVPALDGRHQWAPGRPSPYVAWQVASFDLADGYAAAVAHPAATGPAKFSEIPDWLLH